MIRPLVKLWQSKGPKAIIYLDDGIVSVKGEHQAVEASSQVKLDLENAGFVINTEKSSWAPSQAMEWLGFRIDLVKGMLSVPARKLKALQLIVNQARATTGVPARQLASIIEKIVSMSLGLGPNTHLINRSLYANLNKRTAGVSDYT